MKSQKEKWNLKKKKKKKETKKFKKQKNKEKKKKKWKQNIFRTQKFRNSINVTVRQCQDVLNVSVR